MGKMVKTGRSRRLLKLATGKGKKSRKSTDTVVTLEASLASAPGETGEQAETEKPSALGQESFTDCAHMRQVMCLLPSSNPASKEDKQKESDSDDGEMSDGKRQGGNLQLPGNKGLSVYMKVSKFALPLGARPSTEHIIRGGPKQKK